MYTLITVGELKTGDVIVQFPYAGGEKLPVTVKWMHPARKKGYMVVEGTDADGHPVMVPAGHRGQMIRVKEAQ